MKNSCLDLWQFLLRKPSYLLSAVNFFLKLKLMLIKHEFSRENFTFIKVHRIHIW